MLYKYKYYTVNGFNNKYTLYTDALNLALIYYAGRATKNITECYAVTDNKQTANKYTITGVVK